VIYTVQDILKMLEQLKDEELKEFKWHLKNSDIGEHLPCIPSSRLEKTDMWDLVDLMLQTYNQQSVEVTKRVFKKIKRNDLVQMLLNKTTEVVKSLNMIKYHCVLISQQRNT
uniref:Pyrin domain-containing protein n=1 Tax=Anabas testudineus TaxID=64144 RepID=A0A3Q1HM53_ANATE